MHAPWTIQASSAALHSLPLSLEGLKSLTWPDTSPSLNSHSIDSIRPNFRNLLLIFMTLAANRRHTENPDHQIPVPNMTPKFVDKRFEGYTWLFQITFTARRLEAHACPASAHLMLALKRARELLLQILQQQIQGLSSHPDMRVASMRTWWDHRGDPLKQYSNEPHNLTGGAIYPDREIFPEGGKSAQTEPLKGTCGRPETHQGYALPGS
jgi:hypothetical protein